MEKYEAIHAAEQNILKTLKEFGLDSHVPSSTPLAAIFEMPVEFKNEYLDLESSLLTQEISPGTFLVSVHAITCALRVRVIRDRLVKKFNARPN